MDARRRKAGVEQPALQRARSQCGVAPFAVRRVDLDELGEDRARPLHILRYKRTTWPYGSSVWGKKEWVCPDIRDASVVSMDEGGTNLQPIANGALVLALDTDFDGCMTIVQRLA